MPKHAIIIGAGPAGLTAAYELLTRTDLKPIILEKTGEIGGISKTVNYKGNRIDIGGHRFFSKSHRVMQWWFRFMPLEPTAEKEVSIRYQNRERKLHTENPSGPTPVDKDKVMLLRRRLSRIYYLRRFFNYPLKLSFDTLRKLGFSRTVIIGCSYTWARVFPRRKERSLEDFMINRFGKALYKTFFKDYTEKIWGVSCREISSEWGAQRIKGLSVSKALLHALKKNKAQGGIAQKDLETSQIERFLYPKLGPGQLWEEVAQQIKTMGGEIHFFQNIVGISSEKNKITSIQSIDARSGESQTWQGEYYFSTMPIKELIAGMTCGVPAKVREIAAGLQYRDFITVGLLLKQFSAPAATANPATDPQKIQLEDTWIYVQEKDVRVGRLQLFNNWSPFLVKDPGTSWIGMEYFCNVDDDFWNLSDPAIKETAIAELEKIGLARKEDLLDATVIRMEKTYPAYFGTYGQFDLIRNFVDSFQNLYLIGRNGMHKYNNADHSMLTAMTAVDNIVAGISDKSNIWSINTEQDYHEETK